MIENLLPSTRAPSLILRAVAKMMGEEFANQLRLANDDDGADLYPRDVAVVLESAQPFEPRGTNDQRTILNIALVGHASSEKPDSATKSHRNVSIVLEITGFGKGRADRLGGQVQPSTDAAFRSQETSDIACQIMTAATHRVVGPDIGIEITRPPALMNVAGGHGEQTSTFASCYQTRLIFVIGYQESKVLEEMPNVIDSIHWQPRFSDSGELITEGQI